MFKVGDIVQRKPREFFNYSYAVDTFGGMEPGDIGTVTELADGPGDRQSMRIRCHKNGYIHHGLHSSNSYVLYVPAERKKTGFGKFLEVHSL